MTFLNRPLNRWFTVLAGALGCAAGSGVISSYVFGMFIKAISDEYGWDRSVTTLSILCFYLACGVGCLWLGHIMAKWGVRRSAILFVSLFSLSVASVGLLPKSVFLFCLAFASMGFFGAAASALPYAVAIAAWFDKKRGLALALAVGGTGLSAIFMPSYASWLMANYGWRGGYVGVGIFCAVVALTGLIFFFRMPAEQAAQPSRGIGDWRQLVTREYIRIALPILLISIALMGCITNLPPIFTDRGMALADAAKLLGVLGGASLLSRLLVGILLDRIHVRWVSMTMFLLVALGVALILSGATGPVLVFAMIAIGFGIGSEADIIAYAVSRYFARAQLPAALGGTWVFWAWGGGIGVIVGSLSFDLTGSYSTALIFYIALALISAGVIATLGAYTEHQSEGGH